MRSLVPIIITAIVGIFMILQYFITNEPDTVGSHIHTVSDEIKQWGNITLAFAIVLGVLNLTRINLKAVLEQKRDWGYKVVLLLSMVFMITIGGIKWYLEEKVNLANTAVADARDANPGAADDHPAVSAALAEVAAAQARTEETLFEFTYDSIYTPLSATIYSLLAFYVASAAFRSFRAKNLPSTLLLVSAVLVMIGAVPVGGLLMVELASGETWRPLVWLKDWLMTWPNGAGQRAILMGAALGMIATGLRVIFGIERPYLRG